MNEAKDPKKSEEITLKMKIEDILEVVSKSGSRAMISDNASHIAEGEDLKKAWFRHVLSSMEKLGSLVETIRSVDMTNLKSDLKDEIRKVEARLDRIEQQIRDNRKELSEKAETIDKTLTAKIDSSYKELLSRVEELNRDLQAYKLNVDVKFNDADKELSAYKKDVIQPLKDALLTISVKIGIFAALAGFMGSGIFAGLAYLIKIYIFKTP